MSSHQQSRDNEKKSLLVSISSSAAANKPGVSSGYDSLSTIATQMHLPLTSTTTTMSGTLIGEQSRRNKRPAPKFREPAPFEPISTFSLSTFSHRSIYHGLLLIFFQTFIFKKMHTLPKILYIRLIIIVYISPQGASIRGVYLNSMI